ncbi:MAG: amidophosphoribosyltransferase [Candidatus Aminicenantes bacterium]|nr:amidophosphoribosyltransferase [Candidatus Aminicenantes bacterium]
MGGFFGIISKTNAVKDLFFGTDYHSHLGTKRGGLAVKKQNGFFKSIHSIENALFRSKFADEVRDLRGNSGIGVISDYENQPLVIRSHLGDYAIVTVSAINNMEFLYQKALKNKGIHFSESSRGEINPTELVAALINQEQSFEKGIVNVQESIKGSCSILILTEKGLYASRDKLGRTPIVLGEKKDSYAVTLETCAFPNLNFKTIQYLGPGEIVFMTEQGIEQKKSPQKNMQICAFLWVYYGYPSSSYEGINVEFVRNQCGAKLSENDDIQPDFVAGIPDSGIAHGLGYANKAGIPFKRPFVKYTPTWQRSFMPQEQKSRDLVATMKLIPVHKMIRQKKLLFCEDSIVRGTQLKDTIQRLFDLGALEVHMRPACPPLLFKCKFLNFSRSKSELDLAARKAIIQLEGQDFSGIQEYTQYGSDKYSQMVDKIRQRLNLTSLKYQKLNDLVEAIGLPKQRLCTYCWDGTEPYA